MADWHKIYSADWINLTYQVPDPQLASSLLMLMMHCLNQGGLPDDNEEIADITRLPVEIVEAVRGLRCVKRISEVRDDKLYFNVVSQMIEERAEFGRKQAQRATGGKRPPDPAPASGGEPSTDEESHGKPRQATASHGEPIQSVNQSSKQADTRAPAREPAPGGETGGSKPQPDDGQLRDEIERLVRNRTGTLHNGSGSIERRVNAEVADLIETGASLEEITEFDHSRKKAVTLGYYATDFCKWRADRAHAPTEGNVVQYENFTGKGRAALAEAKRLAEERRNNGNSKFTTT